MKEALDRITRTVAIAALAITLLAFLVGGKPMALGALGGGLLSVANARAIAWVAARVIAGDTKTRAVLLSLLGVKTAILGTCVWVLAKVVHLDGLGLCLGLSSLVLGLLVASLGIAKAAAEQEG